MKKGKFNFWLSISLTIISLNSFCQDFYHGFGGQLVVGIYELAYTSPTKSYSESSGAAVPSAFYKATLGFDKIGISAYPGLGFDISANSRSGGSGSIAFSFPVNAEYYIGDMDDACFFAGAGFNYTYVATSETGGGSVYGPEVGLGGQFNFKDNLIGLRLAYTYGLNKSGIDVPGINITTDTRSVFTVGVYYLIGN